MTDTAFGAQNWRWSTVETFSRFLIDSSICCLRPAHTTLMG